MSLWNKLFNRRYQPKRDLSPMDGAVWDLVEQCCVAVGEAQADLTSFMNQDFLEAFDTVGWEPLYAGLTAAGARGEASELARHDNLLLVLSGFTQPVDEVTGLLEKTYGGYFDFLDSLVDGAASADGVDVVCHVLVGQEDQKPSWAQICVRPVTNQGRSVAGLVLPMQAMTQSDWSRVPAEIT